jgi:hypothetical protein
VTSAETALNLFETLKKSLAAVDKVKSGYGGAEYRVQSFWERSSLKPSVELIVTKTEAGVPFQSGATLTPILAAFVPKLLWPDKPSIAVGQIFNNTFHIGEVADTYISPSHVGEVFWNFGWLGTLLLMPLIGVLLGVIGSKCNAAASLSLTGLMVTVVTIRLLVINSESSIATEYVVWLRSMAAILLLRLAFAKAAVIPDSRRGDIGSGEGDPAAGHDDAITSGTPARFPHLLH